MTEDISFIHSLNKYLLSVCYTAGTILGARQKTMNKMSTMIQSSRGQKHVEIKVLAEPCSYWGVNMFPVTRGCLGLAATSLQVLPLSSYHLLLFICIMSPSASLLTRIYVMTFKNHLDDPGYVPSPKILNFILYLLPHRRYSQVLGTRKWIYLWRGHFAAYHRQ